MQTAAAICFRQFFDPRANEEEKQSLSHSVKCHMLLPSALANLPTHGGEKERYSLLSSDDQLLIPTTPACVNDLRASEKENTFPSLLGCQLLLPTALATCPNHEPARKRNALGISADSQLLLSSTSVCLPNLRAGEKRSALSRASDAKCYYQMLWLHARYTCQRERKYSPSLFEC